LGISCFRNIAMTATNLTISENQEGTKEPSRTDVWKMFDRVAHRYDFLNRVLSMGIDRFWRMKMSSLLPTAGNLEVLDLATGTADQLLFLFHTSHRVKSGIGMDLSERMLEIGRRKVVKQGLSDRITLRSGDAMDIPVEANRFDVVTMSFGIRNVVDVDRALREMYRVLRPGGRLLILEFSLPGCPFIRSGYLFYLRHVLPRIGAFISGDPYAYRYLNETIETFRSGTDFCTCMERTGFSDPAAHPVTFGIATVYKGNKPIA
jgi:demethylmenaquinone methyltransferase / 2-methoxy-6-polyprenyl-1,4-benzoquinol methylase